MSIEISDCLKRERDICVKTIMPDQNMAFRRTPTLIDSIVISLTWLSTYMSADCSEPLYFSTHAKEKKRANLAHPIPCQVPCFALTSSSLAILYIPFNDQMKTRENSRLCTV